MRSPSLSMRTLLLGILGACFLVLFSGVPSSNQASALAIALDLRHVNNATPAQRDLSYIDKDGNVHRCKDVKGSKGGALIAYLVPCIGATIQAKTVTFVTEMITMLRPIMQSFLALVMIFFGIRLAQGGGNIRGDSFAFVFKIGLALSLVQMIPTVIVPTVYDSMSEGQAIVTSTLRASNANYGCDVSTYSGPNTPFLWSQIDCLMGKLYGFTTGTGPDGEKVPNMLLGASAFGFLGGFFFGGTFGVVLFFALVGMLWNMFSLLMRIVTAFLTSYLYAALLLIFGPLFIPMLIFKPTTPYFDSWVKGIIASILMPILITAYAIIALLLYDQMLFAPDSKIKNIFNHSYVEKVQAMPRKLCDVRISGNEAYEEKVEKRPLLSVMTSELRKNFTNPFMTGATNACGDIEIPTIDLTAGDDEGTPAKDIFTQLFMQVVQLLILGYLLQEGFKICMVIINSLAGSPSLSNAIRNSPLDDGFANMRSKVVQAFQRSDAEEAQNKEKREAEDRGLSTEERATKEFNSYKDRVAKTASEGLGGFMQGMQKKR